MIKIILGVAVSIMVAGGGVGLIAQQAKPGDMLYGFKTSINEKIAGLFVTGYTAKVDFEVDLLEERLQEIDELVKEGKMSDEDAVLAKAKVVAQLEKAAAKISEAGNMSLTAAERGRVSASLTRLQSALAKYRSSLNTLDEAVVAAEIAKPSLKKGKNGGKSVAATIADVSVGIEETASSTLDLDIDISEGYDEPEEGVSDESENASDDSIEGEEIEGDEESGDTTADDSNGTTTESGDGETTIGVDSSVEVEADAEVDTTVN